MQEIKQEEFSHAAERTWVNQPSIKSHKTYNKNTPSASLLAFLDGLSSRGLKTMSALTAGESGDGSPAGGAMVQNLKDF